MLCQPAAADPTTAASTGTSPSPALSGGWPSGLGLGRHRAPRPATTPDTSAARRRSAAAALANSSPFVSIATDGNDCDDTTPDALAARDASAVTSAGGLRCASLLAHLQLLDDPARGVGGGGGKIKRVARGGETERVSRTAVRLVASTAAAAISASGAASASRQRRRRRSMPSPSPAQKWPSAGSTAANASMRDTPGAAATVSDGPSAAGAAAAAAAAGTPPPPPLRRRVTFATLRAALPGGGTSSGRSTRRSELGGE